MQRQFGSLAIGEIDILQNDKLKRGYNCNVFLILCLVVQSSKIWIACLAGGHSCKLNECFPGYGEIC